MPVIDTTVALKWLFREGGSEQALALLDREDRFFAPDYIEVELLSGITKNVRAGLITKEEANLKREQCQRLPIQQIPLRRVRELAYQLATEYSISFFDALFLATAIDLNKPLVTADEKLVASLETSPMSPFILSLNQN